MARTTHKSRAGAAELLIDVGAREDNAPHPPIVGIDATSVGRGGVVITSYQSAPRQIVCRVVIDARHHHGGAVMVDKVLLITTLLSAYIHIDAGAGFPAKWHS